MKNMGAPLKNSISDDVVNRICRNIDIPDGTPKRISELTLNKIRMHAKERRANAFFRYATVVLLFLFVGASSLYLTRSLASDDSQMMTVSVPFGDHSTVCLPDGTEIWLNSGSTLTYPSDFSSENRSISLKGEAFFDVRKNPSSPFHVSAGEIDICVLGTKFNVNAYGGECPTEVMLVEGSVRLCSATVSTMLVPGEKATLTDKGSFTVDKVADYSPYTAWKDGRMVFKGETFSDLAKKLERRHNVIITIRDRNLARERMTGEFTDEDINEIMAILRKSMKFDYNILGNEIIVF